jgi:hypothetical protein
LTFVELAQNHLRYPATGAQRPALRRFSIHSTDVNLFRAYDRRMGCAKLEAVDAEALIGTLAELLRELAGAAEEWGLSWLRPLAVLAAEIEFSSLRQSKLASTVIADECRELAGLLGGSSGIDAEFAARYASLTQASGRVAHLHERALSISRAIAGYATCGGPF